MLAKLLLPCRFVIAAVSAAVSAAAAAASAAAAATCYIDELADQ